MPPPWANTAGPHDGDNVQPRQPQGDVGADGQSPQPSAQQKACQHGKEELEGKGDQGNGDLDKSARPNEGYKEGA